MNKNSNKFNKEIKIQLTNIKKEKTVVKLLKKENIKNKLEKF